MTHIPNPFVTADQDRLRELVFAMAKSERPISTSDLTKLSPFVHVVRSETAEDRTPGRRGIRRTDYYMLNELGIVLLRQWRTGKLDGLFGG